MCERGTILHNLSSANGSKDLNNKNGSSSNSKEWREEGVISMIKFTILHTDVTWLAVLTDKDHLQMGNETVLEQFLPEKNGDHITW